MTGSIRALAVLALLGPAVTGCAVLAPGEGHSGGVATMGDAATAANADSTKKVRRMDVGNETPPAVEADVLVTTGEALQPDESAALPPAPAPAPHPPARPLFGVVGGAGLLGGEDYDHYQTVGLTGGNFETGRVRLDILATASGVFFKGESQLGRALTDAVDLELAVTGRYYLTPQHTFVGAYGIAGLGTGTLFWNYAQPVPVIQDGVTTTVDADHINHFDMFAGAGTSLMQVRHLHFGANLVGGVRFYGWHTVNGFENDLLPTTGFLRVLLEIEYRL